MNDTYPILQPNYQHVLILGDGNFSFSWSLTDKLSTKNTNFKIICSSFDSRDEVLQKYPESSFFLSKLSKFQNVTIVHGINASTSLKNQLEDKESAGINHVIFNFPHIGIENLKLHRCLLAHIFHRFDESL